VSGQPRLGTRPGGLGDSETQAVTGELASASESGLGRTDDASPGGAYLGPGLQLEAGAHPPARECPSSPSHRHVHRGGVESDAPLTDSDAAGGVAVPTEAVPQKLRVWQPGGAPATAKQLTRNRRLPSGQGRLHWQGLVGVTGSRP
jgi:hypothetical protein